MYSEFTRNFTNVLISLTITLRAILSPDRLERETGIEPATFSLARRCSTTEPLPHPAQLPLYKWAVRDSNSHGSSPTDPKSALSTNFSNRPYIQHKVTMLPLVDNTSVTSSLSSQFAPTKTFSSLYGTLKQKRDVLLCRFTIG
jgi:hypothetical protein